MAPAAGAEQGEPARQVVLPSRLPAQCVQSAAEDYGIHPLVMLAVIKTESDGKSVVSTNRNGSQDLGVSQHNTDSWVPYFAKRYGISPQSLVDNPCQSIRCLAYVLRMEWNTPACRGSEVWCAVGRYHAPNNQAHQAIYVPKVQRAYVDMLQQGTFDRGRARVNVSAGVVPQRSSNTAPAPEPMSPQRIEWDAPQ